MNNNDNNQNALASCSKNLTTDRKQDFKVKNAIELDVLEQNEQHQQQY